ncbi:MAG TPA: OmpA family protein [Anaeromyxobacteraceae bacterium]|nr:OmpA family protein [Anaeromyxobacteraceae bacterium]
MRRHGIQAAALAASLVIGCKTPDRKAAAGAGATAEGAGAADAGGGQALSGGVSAVAGGSIGLYLDKQVKELAEVVEAKRNDNGVIVNVKCELLFGAGSAKLKEEAVAQLDKVGDVVAKYSDDHVRVEGYTDSKGRSSRNKALSRRRAEAVKQVLVSRGVKEAQVTAVGLGAVKPIASNKTVAGRATNRRIELHIEVPNPT